MAMQNFEKQKQQYLDLIEKTLDEVLPLPSESSSVLNLAMRDAVGSGGKRIRPLLCLAVAMACGGDPKNACYEAAAIELLHTYTLIHDDLPAMDNDEMRRGKPSTWKAFGEANAILAGDMLQALAFRVLYENCDNLKPAIEALSLAAINVIEGQVFDLNGATRKENNLESIQQLEETYSLKTGALFVAAAQLGAISACATREEYNNITLMANYLGLAFQYQDDLIDGDSFLSPEELSLKVQTNTTEAISCLKDLPGDTTFLIRLIEKLVGRKV